MKRLKTSVLIVIAICLFCSFSWAAGKQEDGSSAKPNTSALAGNIIPKSETTFEEAVKKGNYYKQLANVPAALKKYKIAFLVPTLDVYFPEMQRGANEAAAKAGIELFNYDAANDPAKQISQVENALSRGADMVVIVPVEADALNLTVQNLMNKGIPVICDNRDVTNAKRLSYLGTDDYQAGKIAVDLAVEALTKKFGSPKGNIVIIEGQPGSSPQIARSRAYDEVLKQYPEIKILDRNTANWKEENARALMESWLSKFDKIDLVLTQGDIDAWGAWFAAKAVGKDQDILFVGINGWKQTHDWIKQGKMYGSAFQDPYGEGVCGVNVAIRYLQGEKIPEYVPVPVDKVDATNVDQHPGW